MARVLKCWASKSLFVGIATIGRLLEGTRRITNHEVTNCCACDGLFNLYSRSRQTPFAKEVKDLACTCICFREQTLELRFSLLKPVYGILLVVD